MLQTELEYLVPIYIDHVSGPLNVGKTNFLYFTLSTWREAAGLNTSGFRRSTDGTTFFYGLMQSGDIIGSWIFEDIAKGFSGLRQVVWGNYTVTYKKKSVATSQQTQTPEQLRQLCISMWNTASWQSSGYVAARAMASGSFSYNPRFNEYSGHAEAYRDAWKVTLLFPSNCVARSVDEYFQPQVYASFYDIDSLGLEGQGILTMIKKIPVFSGTTYELEWIGEGEDVCPWALIAVALPSPPPDYSRNYAYRGGAAFIVKPHFTHQNP